MEKLYTDIPIATLEEWADTKDQALIRYYMSALDEALKQRDDHLSQVNEVDNHIEDLNKTFGHLREKYPEHFI